MSDQHQNQLREGSPFEAIRHEDEDGSEYWSARDLAKVLGYTRYDKFLNAVKKAELACANSGQKVSDHMSHVRHMVKIGSGAEREVEDVHLSRYACYLCVENADPSKPVVALGQTYFATQARKQELLEEGRRLGTYDRLMDTTSLLKDTVATKTGIVRARDFAVFQDAGYMGLYNGETAQDIQHRKGLKKSQEITDYMGWAELSANDFRASQAAVAIHSQGITDPEKALELHYQVGQVTREAMQKTGGVMPEDMPTPTESIQKVKRKRLKQKPPMPEFRKPKSENEPE